jgi:hypothetical protein
MTIKLTSREVEVLRRWGKDPDLIAGACHKRPDWLDELMAAAELHDHGISSADKRQERQDIEVHNREDGKIAASWIASSAPSTTSDAGDRNVEEHLHGARPRRG